jgi:NAD(P) transhydrogenase subunit alpha
MIIGVPREVFPGERRVALAPAVIPNLAKAGFEVRIEAGAGTGAGYLDADYAAKGAKIIAERREVFRSADVVAQVLCYGSNDKAGAADLPLLRRGQILVGFLRPLGSLDTLKEIAATGVTSFSVELMPRTTRAQSMDALSSMATICGYKAVVLAADTLPRLFPMLTTAAGTITPARVFVIGAGVSGLQAIATARRLGGVVSAFDIRPAAREQILSLGATFVESSALSVTAETEAGYARVQTDDERANTLLVIANHVKDVDLVITTANVPGKKSPRLITEQTVRAMRPGAVIVDIAAENGGNTELTRAGETVHAHGVTIIGAVNLPSTVPYHASQMFGRNVFALLQHLIKEGNLTIDPHDEITAAMLMTHAGKVIR